MGGDEHSDWKFHQQRDWMHGFDCLASACIARLLRNFPGAYLRSGPAISVVSAVPCLESVDML